MTKAFTGGRGQYLVWTKRYARMFVHEADTLEEAVTYARAGVDAREHTFSHVERLGVGVVSTAEVKALWVGMDTDEDTEWEARRLPTHVLEVRPLGSHEWASLRDVYDDDPDTSAEAARFGVDRVRLSEVQH